MKKKLPFYTDPIFKTYNIAVLGGIVLANKKHEPFYLSNYTLLKSKTSGKIQLTFIDDLCFTCPWQFKSYVSRISCFSPNIIKAMFVDMLNQGYYIHAAIDDFYIPFRPLHNIEHFQHDISIIGFDDVKNIFYTVCWDRFNKYAEHEISMDLLASSASNDFEYGQTFFIRPVEAMPSEFNMDYFIKTLRWYIDSVDPEGNNISDEKFGHAAQYILLNYFKANDFDMRAFRVLWEQKKLMVARLKYIASNLIKDFDLSFIEKYETLSKKCEAMFFLILKYTITKNIEDINRSKKIFFEVLNEDKLLAENLYIFLTDKSCF